MFLARLHRMFVLYPDGKDGSGGAGGSSQFMAKLSFFGQLSLYFVGIRLAYVFFGAKADHQQALQN